jgi:hypothetical protein
MPVAEKPKSRTIKGLKKHSGEWVAIVGDRVIASADTLDALRGQVGDREIDGVLRVPPPRRGAGVFL